MKCPICKKGVLFVGVHDDEGNYHGLVGCDYESDPWSGLSYALHHKGWGECPLCTDGEYGPMGGMLFDTAEEAIASLIPPNEPLTIGQLREMDGEPVWFDTIKRWGIVKVCRDGVFVLTKSGEFEVGRCKYYRRPPERQEDTDA